jgi:hypothetical protein
MKWKKCVPINFGRFCKDIKTWEIFRQLSIVYSMFYVKTLATLTICSALVCQHNGFVVVDLRESFIDPSYTASPVGCCYMLFMLYELNEV